jgi:hypothetical protein
MGAAAAANGFSLGVMVVPFCNVVSETHDEMDRQVVTCDGKMFRNLPFISKDCEVCTMA